MKKPRPDEALGFFGLQPDFVWYGHWIKTHARVEKHRRAHNSPAYSGSGNPDTPTRRANTAPSSSVAPLAGRIDVT